MTTWKSFLTRATSAIIALALIIGLYVTLAVDGIKIAVCLIVAIGAYELLGILFKNENSKFLKYFFYVLSLAVFAASISSLSVGSLAFSLSLITYIIAVLLVSHKQGELNSMATYCAKGALGLFYIGLLPSFAYRILEHNNGIAWFTFLLAVVFAGDTMAYIFGVLIGRHKVMPSVSPKKTWEGSIGGTVGSLLAAVICWLAMFPEVSLTPLLILAALAGFAGQFGDFFESLLKRVSDVKDSGKIMPGHGGVLDRVDAVLFASPVILSGILILSHLLS
ncbi:phosphatidate cytidylyltransferase [Bdellovibrio reynosensis]|uniref:Phosphatidate cytidylyltransferase n=1 Tax=Bdellovibrio reynosensis TaxID=2835041 RepID=A0ABY4C6G6_9BACT|nr:phosphatidate cytidylyltransferase [Bdellovibrio reynosensis]UOF00515.1 phosphatidate cytidylyltransferase [Bdellovibrio reynosensis]